MREVNGMEESPGLRWTSPRAGWSRELERSPGWGCSRGCSLEQDAVDHTAGLMTCCLASCNSAGMRQCCPSAAPYEFRRGFSNEDGQQINSKMSYIKSYSQHFL